MRLLRNFQQTISTIQGINEDLDEIKINQGIILAAMKEHLKSTNLQDFEFKIFSQWGEDGIIQRLLNVVEIRDRTFIEFGVEDFFESNCRFLLMKDNWSGYVIDGSPQNIERLKKSYFYWRHQIEATCAYITRDNINELLAAKWILGRFRHSLH